MSAAVVRSLERGGWRVNLDILVRGAADLIVVFLLVFVVFGRWVPAELWFPGRPAAEAPAVGGGANGSDFITTVTAIASTLVVVIIR